MRVMWFRWERDHALRWCPTIHHGDKPEVTKSSQGDPVRQTEAVQVPDDCIVNGEPLFGKLVERFPMPRVE